MVCGRVRVVCDMWEGEVVNIVWEGEWYVGVSGGKSGGVW